MEVNVAGMYRVAILQDVKVGDETVIVLITLRRVSGMFNERGDSVLQFGNGALESCDLGSVL